MHTEVFYWVLNTSIIGSLTGLILLALRRIRRLPRFAVYVLWCVPFIRFWLPVGLANPYSMMNLLSRFHAPVLIPCAAMDHVTLSNYIGIADRYFPLVFKTPQPARVFSMLAVLWLIVAAAAVLAAIALYAWTKSALRDRTRIGDRLYRSDMVTSPAVYGVFHPKIILPREVPAPALPYILLHEQVHMRRRDNLLRVLAIVTACVHWFNPLVWLCLKAFFTDMELACDAGVLKRLDPAEKKAYAGALLDCAAPRTVFSSAFGGSKVRVRIENVLCYRKLTRLSATACVLLVAAVMVTLLTNPVG